MGLARRTLALALGVLAALALVAAPAAAAPVPTVPTAATSATGRGATATGDGPPLTVPGAALVRSLVCTGDLTRGPTPVLLIPGTALTPAEFSWNYVRAFTAAGRPFCTVTLPDHAMSDIQISAEYVVSAIRTMQQKAGRKISVIGHSQGGMIFRWALKFWPDTRRDVDDVIGLAPSNHGTADAQVACAGTGCAPSIFQQKLDSRFYRALNSGPETYPEPSYTVAYTEFDEVVFPNVDTTRFVPPDAVPPPSSELRGGGANVANLSLQSVCPGRAADHLTTGTSDAVAYAIALDALQNPGPARRERINRATCLQPFMPGVNPATFPTDFAGVVATAVTQVATYPHVLTEPPLQPYAVAAARG